MILSRLRLVLGTPEGLELLLQAFANFGESNHYIDQPKQTQLVAGER